MRALMTAFARNTVFANILLILILVAGLVASRCMVREAFPQMPLDRITVSVPYPGADPVEVEEGICRRLEEAIQGIEGIKHYHTSASEGMGTAWIEVHQDYKTATVLDRVRNQVDAISSFPLDAEKPITREYLLKATVLLVSLSGDMSEQRLKHWAQVTKDEILRLEDVSQVKFYGIRKNEISIEVSETQLQRYGLSLHDVANAVRRSNLNMAGGTLRTAGEEIRVRTLGRKYHAREFAEIVLLADAQGDVITLDQVAEIRDTFEEDPIISTLNGQPAVFLSILKTPQEDALKISQSINRLVRQKQPDLPEECRMAVLYDTSQNLLQARINLLAKNGLIGLILVFLALWCFLDLRLSFWAGMGMPLSIAGALVILWFVGGTINMVSLFGLTMVLGIIVDDAIVVGEAIYLHRSQGKPPLKAAVDGVFEVGLPVLAATATTVVALIPLLYINGIMGKLTRILPVVAISCLIISLVECLFMLPAHLSHLPDPRTVRQPRNLLGRVIFTFHHWTQQGLERFQERTYRRLLQGCMQWRYVLLAGAISLLLMTVGLGLGGFLKFEVFEKLDGFIVTANLEFPAGTPAAVTQKAVDRLEAALMEISERTPTTSGRPLVEDRITTVGATLEEEGTRYGPHTGGMQVVLCPSEQRNIHSETLLFEWKKQVGNIPGVKSLTFVGLSAGPPGSPIEIWVQGQDMSEILAGSEALMEHLHSYDGVYQIRSNHSPGKRELRLALKPEAHTLGLTVQDLAGQIYAGYYGEEALRLQRGRDDIRVKIRYPQDERQRISDLDHIRIRTQDGREVPLHTVAEVRFEPGDSEITRTDGLRSVTVCADIANGRANPTEILRSLHHDFLPALQRRHPGLSITLQGEQEKMRESFSSLATSYPLALLGIYVIVATIFRSYLQPLVIMVAIPFGILGAVYGHMAMGLNLSMMSVFGMVALAGVVVNDAIVLIEAINTHIAQGRPFFAAIVQGSLRRFRPVFLTTLSTVGGLLPMILERNMQTRFLIPMAVSIAAGVAFATLLTLILIPSLLVILNDLRRLGHRVLMGHWPTREQVEPAIRRCPTETESQTETEEPGVAALPV